MLFLTTLNSINDCGIRNDHKQALIKTIKNAEKEAKMQERLTFLIKCRREGIVPRFIADSISAVNKIFTCRDSLENRKRAFCRQLLSEAISETHRMIAYLHREYRRLSHRREDYSHPITSWTEGRAIHIYRETAVFCRQRLIKKFRGLVAEQKVQSEQLCTPGLNRLKNMSHKTLGEPLQALLAKGPTFALTRR